MYYKHLIRWFNNKNERTPMRAAWYFEATKNTRNEQTIRGYNVISHRIRYIYYYHICHFLVFRLLVFQIHTASFENRTACE